MPEVMVCWRARMMLGVSDLLVGKLYLNGCVLWSEGSD
jgi:hypothetical protein